MTYSLRLDTSRLIIVGISDIDTEQLSRYFAENYPHLTQGGGKVPSTDTEVQRLYEVWQDNIHNDTEVRFFLLREERIIGIIGISNIVRGAFHAAYLGYNIAAAEQGKGLMTEALQEVIPFAFEALNLHRLMANYRPENLASGRVLAKLGFVKEGFAEKYLMVNGEWADHVLTALRNDNWRNG